MGNIIEERKALLSKIQQLIKKKAQLEEDLIKVNQELLETVGEYSPDMAEIFMFIIDKQKLF